jgi:hypothetical protein
MWIFPTKDSVNDVFYSYKQLVLRPNRYYLEHRTVFRRLSEPIRTRITQKNILGGWGRPYAYSRVKTVDPRGHSKMRHASIYPIRKQFLRQFSYIGK